MYTIKRACTFPVTIVTPKPPATYTEMLLTFQQKQRNMITKTEADMTTTDTAVYVVLTQEETALLTEGIPCLMQLRCYSGSNDAPGSAIWELEVMDALDDRILGQGG